MTTLTPEHFQTGIENLHDAVMISQCKGGNPLVFVNDSFTQLLGYTLEDVLEKPFDFIYATGENDQKEFEVSTLKNSMKNRSSTMVNLLAYKKDGSSFQAQVSISQLKNPRGRTTHYMSIIRDITTHANLENQLFIENSKLYEEVQQLKVGSKYDLATGLLNRTALTNEVKGLFSGAKRAEDHFTLFFIGINGYEEMANQIEKTELDATLQQLGSLFQNNLKRESDIVFKYSDSEFVICFTGQNKENSILFAQKLQNSVSEQLFANKHQLTVSIGVYSEIPPKKYDINQALLSADLNMHSTRLECA